MNPANWPPFPAGVTLDVTGTVATLRSYDALDPERTYTLQVGFNAPMGNLDDLIKVVAGTPPMGKPPRRRRAKP